MFPLESMRTLEAVAGECAFFTEEQCDTPIVDGDDDVVDSVLSVCVDSVSGVLANGLVDVSPELCNTLAVEGYDAVDASDASVCVAFVTGVLANGLVAVLPELYDTLAVERDDAVNASGPQFALPPCLVGSSMISLLFHLDSCLPPVSVMCFQLHRLQLQRVT